MSDTMQDWRTKYRVTVPEGEQGPWKIERFEIASDSFESFRHTVDGRSPGSGTFTRLTRNGSIWMSDTNAEQRDHSDAFHQITYVQPETPDQVPSMLIHGLDIGMVLQQAILSATIGRIDVVEMEQDVIDLVGPHYVAMADEHDTRLTIHCDNALTKKWPSGSYWNIVWHDIWKDLCEDNLTEMHKLHRSYGRRCGWQGSWSRETLEYERRRTADAWWRR